MKLRNVLTIIAAMAVCSVATAQSASLNFEPEGKNVVKVNMQNYVGSDGQSVVYLQRKGLLGTSVELASYDMEQREQARVKYCNVRIDNSYDRPIHEALVNGSHLDLVTTLRPKEGGLKVEHERRNIATLALEGDTRTLITVDGIKDDNIFFFSATSPNGKLVAIATAKVSKGLGAEVKVSLYSRELEEYWSMEVPAQGFGDLLVTNEGEVVMVGMSEKERKGRVQVIVADGEKSERMQYTYDAAGVLLEWEPARYQEGKLLVVALMRDDYKTFMRVGSNPDCVDAITCDIASGTLSRDRHTFTTEELCRMENKKGVKTNYNWIEFGNLVQVEGDSEGAFVVIDNQWDTYRNGSLAYRERRGMMVLRIGKEGRFEWSRTWRSYAMVNWGSLDWVGYRWVRTDEGIMLVWPRNQKDALLADEAAVKGTKGHKAKADLEVVFLGRDGSTKSRRFDIGKQGLLGQAQPLADNNWLVLVGTTSKGAFGKVKVEF